ncbi:MAG: tRNA 2-thiouridine(34) synthase MnmA [Nanoarchaeota archaeon]|nr:tRNA 2-thiouridine(34) synthase MnmA [Nanoarchaeota archaeon]
MVKKVILAMSGGVDSSVAALLLQEQGYEVYGFFMNASPLGKPPWPSTIKWKDEEKTLRKICKKLGIKLIVKNCEKGYEEKVIGPMFKDYERGLTPNPDILCNNVGKFPLLLKLAKEHGADFIATGHYVRVRKGKKGYELLRGKDKKKDQSYFLVGLGQKYLSRVIFPVGGLTKEEVRNIAREAGFENWNKRGSRGICYLGKIDMKKFLRERIKEKHGRVLDSDGNVIGTHPGTWFFTIGEKTGERKGFFLEKKFRKKYAGKKIYVARKEKGNVLVVAPFGHEILKLKKIWIKGLKFVNVKEKVNGKKFKARIRHLGELYGGKLGKSKGRWIFEFSQGQEGVAEGQFIVLYDGERLVGGGEIRLR